MKVAGIVAEFNPFHNGHKRILDIAKHNLGFDQIIVAMSGDFTQRGSISLASKYLRAQCALLNGADIILEIPAIFATASAAEYAKASVLLLAQTGIVNALVFGAETDDIDAFKNYAYKIIQLEHDTVFQGKISDLVKAGYSYAQARAMSLSQYIDEDFISTPNNILGLEYVKTIIEYNLDIEPICVKRSGNNYHQQTLTGALSSASAIRNAIFNDTDFTNSVPENTSILLSEALINGELLNEDSVSLLLHSKLLSQDNYANYWDVTSDLSNRIYNERNNFVKASDFINILKTKELTYTRISRALCHILIGIDKDTVLKAQNNGYILYLRMLGFSSNGSNALKEIKNSAHIPLITSPKECLKFDTDAKNILDIDCYSSDIRRIITTAQTGKSYPNEYNRKFTLNGI